jgi:hypothetical protein
MVSEESLGVGPGVGPGSVAVAQWPEVFSRKSYKNIYMIVDLFHLVMKAFCITLRINFILFVLSCSG